MDPDMNKYDAAHRVTHHPRMTDAEWEEAYRAAWLAYYTPEHVRTILRRAAASKAGRPRTLLGMILWFYLTIILEGVHPLEGGAFRLKCRRDRRPSMKRENPLVFYPRMLIETAVKAHGYLTIFWQFRSMLKQAVNAPDRWTYSDVAITPPQADEFEALSLYHQTTGGEQALARKRRDDAIRDHTTRDLQNVAAE
jgi:hypothetical protein